MSHKQPLSWFWIVVGAVIIAALDIMMRSWLVTTDFALSLSEIAGGKWMIFGIGAVVSYFGGGVVIGRLSPGETIREPAFAAVLAVLCVLALQYTAFPDAPWTGGVFLERAGIALLSFGLALLGAKTGERLQGETTDKMRERGEL